VLRKERSASPCAAPALFFQGDTGPQGFPGTPGEVGPKGEKVSVHRLGKAFLSPSPPT
jgi:hypothetical protein